MQVRIMLPFSLQCGTCGEYIYRGTKFNASKEAAGEYLGIPVWRFYFRCSNCSAEMAMKTDPKNADYVCELGARRNFEPWKEAVRAEGERADAREDEERGDAMRALENRTMDNKREMDVLNALEEDLAVNAQHAGVSTQAALAAVRAGGGAGRAIGSALATGAGAEGTLTGTSTATSSCSSSDSIMVGDAGARTGVSKSGSSAAIKSWVER